MSYATILGILLLAISYMMYNTTHSVFTLMVKEYSFVIGIVGGVGIGLILGGFLGWLFKFRKLKNEEQKIADDNEKI